MPTHHAYPSHGTSDKALQSHLRLNLETEEWSNMGPKQHHSPPIVLDAHCTLTTKKQKGWCSAGMIHVGTRDVKKNV